MANLTAFGFMNPVMNDVKRGSTTLGLGLIDLAQEAFPETVASAFGTTPEKLSSAMDKSIGKQRAESTARGLKGLPGELLGQLPLLANMGGASLATSGLRSGAMFAAAQPTKENESRILNTAIGAGTGWAGGKGLSVLGKAGDKVVTKTGQIYRALEQRIGADEADNLVASFTQGSGLGVDDLHAGFQEAGKKAIQTYQKAIKAGYTKEQARIAALADVNNIPLSKADILQDPAEHALQGAARSGLLTDEAKQFATEFDSAKVASLQNYLRGVGKRLSGEDISQLDYTTASREIADSVYKTVSAAKKNVDALYQQADDAGKYAFLEAKDFSPLRRKMAAAADEVLNVRNSPEVRSLLLDFRKGVLGKGARHNGRITFRDLSRYRKDLTAAQSRATGADQLAIKRIKNAFDEFLDDSITSGRLMGDDAALQSIKAANSAFKQYKGAFWGKEGDGIAGRLFDTVQGKKTTGKVEPEQFIQSLLGGTKNVKAARQLRMLKSAMGQDAEPMLGKIRGLEMRRLMDSGLEEGRKLPGALTFRNRLEQSLTQNKATMRELFGDEGINHLKDASDLTFYSLNVAKDKANPSGSASMLGVAGKTMLDNIPGAIPRNVAKAVVGDIGKIAPSRRVEQGILNPIQAIASTKASNLAEKIGGRVAVPAASEAIRHSAPVKKENRYEGMTDDEIRELLRKRDERTMQKSEIPDWLIHDEGVRSKVYKDTKGRKTVGIGFNMDSGIARDVWSSAGMKKDFDAVYSGEEELSSDEIASLSKQSLKIAQEDARKFLPNFDKLTPARQKAVLNMSYQMGLPALMEFKGFKNAMLNGQYLKASRHLMNSDYARKDAPARAKRVAVMIAGG